MSLFYKDISALFFTTGGNAIYFLICQVKTGEPAWGLEWPSTEVSLTEIGKAKLGGNRKGGTGSVARKAQAPRRSPVHGEGTPSSDKL